MTSLGEGLLAPVGGRGQSCCFFIPRPFPAEIPLQLTCLPENVDGAPLVLLSQIEGCPDSGDPASAWLLAFAVALAKGLVEWGLSGSFVPHYL